MNQNENFQKALDTVCPIKGGGDDKRRFFIEGICECVGVGFDVERFNQREEFESDLLEPSFEMQKNQKGNGSDLSGEQGKGVISKSQRHDGKGIHVVSQSIAETNQNRQFYDQNEEDFYQDDTNSNVDDEEPFLIQCYDIDIEGGGQFFV